MKSVHKSVLLQEVVDGLYIGLQGGETKWYLDGTLGGAGHALAMAKAFKGNVNILGLDADSKAIERANVTLQGQCKRLILETRSYRYLDEVLDKNEVQNIDLMLLDLGLSSDELENSGKGFTFQKDEPLLMTFGDKDYYFNAHDVVNSWKEEDLSNVIFAYGEERYARRIARSIVRYREKKKVETSGELAELVKMSVPPPYRHGKTHPATKTFQALRIVVNDELACLREGLHKGFQRLNSGGRIAVISFHSLEDRIVKNFFQEKKKEGLGEIPSKHIVPSAQEIAENPRSRSAKLRIIHKK